MRTWARARHEEREKTLWSFYVVGQRLVGQRQCTLGMMKADNITGLRKLRKVTSMITIKLGKHSEESYGLPQIR
jgi:hypothetical protein